MKAKWKRLISIDRALLIIVLLVQCFIILHYFNSKSTVAEDQHTNENEILNEPASDGAGNLSDLRLPLPPGYEQNQQRQAESVNDIFDAMNHHMNSMMRRAQMDFERIDSLMSMDEDWDTLMRSPSMDIEEKADRYVVSLSIPGKSASDFSISLEGRLLTISGRYEMQDTMGQSIQQFEKRVLLPRPVNSQNISQTYSDKGVLQIQIMKSDWENGTSTDDLNT